MAVDDNAAPRAERLNTRAAGIISLAVMCSRLLGLAREQVFAALFGGGRAMDAFTVAFRIPNLLRDLFAEGALSTAFVTVFSRTTARRRRRGRLAARQQGRDAHGHVPRRALTLLGMLSRPGWWRCSRPGFDADKAALTVTLTRIMYPFILLVSLAALVMGMLNAKNVFGMPAMASSFFNLGSIVGGVMLGYWLDPHFGPRAVMGLAVGTLIGGALQLAVQLPSLRRARLPLPCRLRLARPGRQRHPAADGALGDRRQHDAGERADQLDVRLDTWATARSSGWPSRSG